MASEDAGIVRAMFRAMSTVASRPEPDMDALAEVFFHPEVTYREDPSWPGADEFHGRDAVAEHFNEYAEFLSMESIELEQVLESGDRLVALWKLRASGTGSGAAAEAEWAWVIEMKDGYLYRFSAHLDRDEALRLAGVQGSSP
jgi:ketosteroid isomerase-like protein